jgi:hypothetical protein
MAYSTIDKSTSYFDTVLWSSQDTSIDTLNFQPDWAWIKSRTNADSHVACDSIRGANKRLSPSSNAVESTTSDELTAFNSDGYTLGTGDNVNRASNNYVSWNWKAGTTSVPSGGSITPSAVSLSTTSGFGIYTYTGTGSAPSTIAHGLGGTPDAVIIKSRTQTPSWIVWYNGFNGRTRWSMDSSNAASTTQTNFFNDTPPTSTLITLGTDSDTNASGQNYVMYVFKNIKGYCKIGTITGNGLTDGPFIYTGFKPSFIMTKKIGGTGDWLIRDIKRDFNGQWRDLYANNNNAETSPDSNTESDIYSNGFKLRMSHTNHNESGATYMFMSFAAEPLVANVGSSIPSTAR